MAVGRHIGHNLSQLLADAASFGHRAVLISSVPVCSAIPLARALVTLFTLGLASTAAVSAVLNELSSDLNAEIDAQIGSHLRSTASGPPMRVHRFREHEAVVALAARVSSAGSETTRHRRIAPQPCKAALADRPPCCPRGTTPILIPLLSAFQSHRRQVEGAELGLDTLPALAFSRLRKPLPHPWAHAAAEAAAESAAEVAVEAAAKTSSPAFGPHCWLDAHHPAAAMHTELAHRAQSCLVSPLQPAQPGDRAAQQPGGYAAEPSAQGEAAYGVGATLAVRSLGGNRWATALPRAGLRPMGAVGAIEITRISAVQASRR